MGKYLSNCNGAVGVRTRAKARAAALAALSSSSMAVKKMKKASSKVSDLRNRRRIAVVSDENFRPETVVINSSSSEVVESTVDYTGSDDVSVDFPASCCSGNDNASISNNIIVDQEVESSETTSSRHLNLDNNDEERKTVELGNLGSRVRKSTVQMNMPSDFEIDAFFAAAEKDLQKRFAERYNFDVVKDMPLEGPYEWVPIKPLIDHTSKDNDDDNNKKTAKDEFFL